ncbi:MAG: SRPBCC domain-containing protein [Pseudomonadota bacterium]
MAADFGAADFGTITLERMMDCSPDKLFGLMTSTQARAVWGTPSETTIFDITISDVKAGGHEIARCGDPDNPEFWARSDFHVVDVPNCIVCSETITVNDEPICVSLVTQEISPASGQSLLKVTVQIASLCGPSMIPDYEDGWTAALAKLSKMAAEPVTAQ